MNWLALLGVLAAGYGVFALYVAWKRPEKIWDMGKVKAFRKSLGENGTSILFTCTAIALLVLGIYLIIK